MIALGQQIRRIPPLVWWLLGIILLYTLLGFFLVPWVAERQLRGILDERLGLTGEIAGISFNPYTMYAELEGLSVTDSDGSPLADLQLLHVNFEPTRLAMLRLQFADIAINRLDFHFQRTSATENTLTRLAQRWADSAAAVEPEPPEEEESGTVPLLLEHIGLSDITIHVRDEVPASPFETTLNLATAEISNVTTLESAEGSNTLVIELEDGARIDWNGNLQVTPPVFTGNISLTSFPLPIVSRYLQDSLPLTIDSGALDVSLSYDIDLSGSSISVALADVNVAIAELAAAQSGQDQPFLRAALISAENGRLHYPDNSVALSALILSELDLTVTRGTDGLTNMQELAAAFSNGSEDTGEVAASSDATPWVIGLESLELERNRVTFADNSLTTPALLGITLDVSLVDLNNQPGSRFPLEASLSVDSGGDLTVSGAVGVLPTPDVATSLILDALDLTVLQPYLDEFLTIDLASGQLAMEAQLISNSDETFGYQGDLRLVNVSAVDRQQNEGLLGLESLLLDDVDLSLTGNTLDVSEVVFQSLFARITINVDGSTNIANTIRAPDSNDPGSEPTETADQATAAQESVASPMNINVGRIRIDNAASNFTDRNLPIVFNANIHGLNGMAEGFATNSSQPMALNLEGNVDEFGLVQITSALNPLNLTGQSDIDLRFRNLSLPAITPYTIKFAGREIEGGNMDVDLNYQVEAGQLTANNRLVLNDLQLGDRVAHPDAMDLPLDLATALLKDSNGVIDLEVPVSGDVNDPEFDLGPAIRRAISNILTSLVSAPFRLLGNLIGGSADDIDSIAFQPGRADIAPPEREVLQQLHEALLQRPQLVLEVPPVSAEADRVILQQNAVNSRIDAGMAALPADSGSLTERRQSVLESLYLEAGLAPGLEELRIASSREIVATNPLTGAQSSTFELDVPAYTEALRSRLIENESVTTEELDDLARTRADAVIRYLLELGMLEETRLEMTEPDAADANSDGWLVMEFGLSAG